ncbi:MAG: hypothetical protein ABIM18_07690 [candidate division WOR-3 bacterium]
MTLLIRALLRFLSWTTITFVAMNHYRLFIYVLYRAGHFILLHFNPFAGIILFLNISLMSLAVLLSKINDQYIDKNECLTLKAGEEKIKPVYTEYTVEKYNNTVKAFFDGKDNAFVDLFGFTMLVGSVLPGSPVVNSILGWIVHLTKFSWILPIIHFTLHNLGFMVFDESHFLIDVEKIKSNADRLRGKKVVFYFANKR